MKIPFLAFGAIVGILAVLLFGSIGVSRMFRRLGWSQDALVAIGVTFLLLAALCIAGWKFGDSEDSQVRRAQHEAEIDAMRERAAEIEAETRRILETKP